MTMQQGLEQLLTRGVLFLPRLGIGAGMFLAAWIAAGVLSTALARVPSFGHVAPDVLALIRRVVRAGLLAIGTVVALGTTGVDVSALVAGLGLTGFALGFALRDILSNLLSGVLLLVYRPFRRADLVSVSGYSGRVSAIDLRYTTLEAEDRLVLIPNATLFTNAITVMRAGARPGAV
jgi:small conductance mechanosensitive channel